MISVCLATFNGSKFLIQQINSILPQIGLNDELIIVDDASTDSTLQILESFTDIRIKLFKNEFNLGVIKTFEKAIRLSNGEFIFLSDQDDIWLPCHVDLMIKKFEEKNCDVVASNFSIIDVNNNVFGCMKNPLVESDSNNNFKNIYKIFSGEMYYYGCCMAFRRKLIPIILPFPKFIESHDLWLGKIGNVLNSIIHVEDILLYRRIHGNNVSVVKRSFFRKFVSRLLFFLSIIVIYNRKLRINGRV